MRIALALMVIIISLSASTSALEPEIHRFVLKDGQTKDFTINILKGHSFHADIAFLNLSDDSNVTLTLTKAFGNAVAKQYHIIPRWLLHEENQNITFSFLPNSESHGEYVFAITTEQPAVLEINATLQDYSDQNTEGDSGLNAPFIELGRSKGYLSTPKQKQQSLDYDVLDIEDKYTLNLPTDGNRLLRILPDQGSWIGAEVTNPDGSIVYGRAAEQPDEVVGMLLRGHNGTLQGVNSMDLYLRVYAVEKTANGTTGGGGYSIEYSEMEDQIVDETLREKKILIHPVFEGPDRERPTITEELYHPPYLLMIGILGIIACGLAISIYTDLKTKKKHHKRKHPLHSYIKDALLQGHPREAIEEYLRYHKWSEKDIQEAFHRVFDGGN